MTLNRNFLSCACLRPLAGSGGRNADGGAGPAGRDRMLVIPCSPLGRLIVSRHKPVERKEEKKPRTRTSVSPPATLWSTRPMASARSSASRRRRSPATRLHVFVIHFDKDRMTLRVPVAKAKSSGLRRLSTRKIMDAALATLKGRSRVKRTMWSRRAQEYEAKINSGDPASIAEVVRDLIATPTSPTSPTASARSTRRRSTGWCANSPPSSTSTRARRRSGSNSC